MLSIVLEELLKRIASDLCVYNLCKWCVCVCAHVIFIESRYKRFDVLHLGINCLHLKACMVFKFRA